MEKTTIIKGQKKFHLYKHEPMKYHTFTIRGGSRKKIAKKIIPKVPTNNQVRITSLKNCTC